MRHPLREVSFDWHDLPVGCLSFGSAGIAIELLPFSERSQSPERYRLELLDIEAITVNLTGRLAKSDLEGLEIASFTFQGDGDRISGKLGFVPGCPSLGYWELGFVNARWCLFGPLPHEL